MDDSGATPSRRQLLRYCTVGTLAGLAGCLGGNGDNGDDTSPEDDDFLAKFELAGDGSLVFEPWLAPEAVHPSGEDATTLFAYQNFERAADEDWGALLDVRQSEAQAFGTDPESLHGEILIGGVDEESGLTSIHLGEFDSDEIVTHFESQDAATTGEYEEYTIIEDQVAIGDDALIVTPEYEAFIDAKHGNGPHLREEYDGVDVLLDLQPDGLQISANQQSGIADLQISGSSFVAVEDNTPVRIIRTFVFESEDDASVERAEEIAEGGNYQQTLTAEHHGRVVMLEYET